MVQRKRRSRVLYKMIDVELDFLRSARLMGISIEARNNLGARPNSEN